MKSRREASQRIPVVVVVLAAIAALFFAFPFLAVAIKLPWSRFGEIFREDKTWQAFFLSIRTSTAAATLSICLGVPLAFLLARKDFPGRRALRVLTTLAMVLPPVVGGVALLFTFGRNGLIGNFLDDWFGLRLPYTSAGVVLAQTFVAMPFVVVAVESALAQSDLRVEDAARTLGASPLRVLWRVTLPSIRPAVFAGAALAFARSLGEFGATITFAGSFPGRTQTLPLLVYSTLDTDPGAALVLSFVLVLVAFVVLAVLRDYWFVGLRGRSGR